MKKVYFLGDSVFDNSPYVDKGESVIEVFKDKYPKIESELLAIDGSVINNVYSQLEKIGDVRTVKIFLSIGGNDLLGVQEYMFSALNNLQELMKRFENVFNEFDSKYGELMQKIKSSGIDDVTVCTIYNPQFDDPIREPLNKIVKSILIAFNECIKKHAFHNGFTVMDLNKMFDSKIYYANPIEPSFEGSKLIVDTTVNYLRN